MLMVADDAAMCHSFSCASLHVLDTRQKLSDLSNLWTKIPKLGTID